VGLVRAFAFAVALLSSSAAPALASAPRQTIEVLPPAPVALLVDGVKVASIGSFPLPKLHPRWIRRCNASGCTIVVTY
jgi:hypothetical protein